MAKGNGKKQEQPKTESVHDIESLLLEKKKEFAAARGCQCYPLLLGRTTIGPSLVDSVFDELRSNFNGCENLDVIIASGGGDIDAAYNLASLFRRYATKRLTFIVPRWAKSAATLLACAGHEILMSPVAELGPLDPQITAMNPLENRVEQFSPLHIESTLQLIRDEFEKGHEKLASGLMNRLQFPLTLGVFRKSIELGETYLAKLLASGMIQNNDEKVKRISKRLTRHYVDHSFCIKIDEAKDIGLNASELSGKELDIVWEMHKLHKKIEELKAKEKTKKLREKMKGIPQELLDSLPAELLGGKEGGAAPSDETVNDGNV